MTGPLDGIEGRSAEDLGFMPASGEAVAGALGRLRQIADGAESVVVIQDPTPMTREEVARIQGMPGTPGEAL